jgi:hypothetical protein
MTEGLWDMQKFLNIIIEIHSYSLIELARRIAGFIKR